MHCIAMMPMAEMSLMMIACLNARLHASHKTDEIDCCDLCLLEWGPNIMQLNGIVFYEWAQI